MRCGLAHPEGSAASTAKRSPMARSNVSIACPYCEAQLDIRVEVQAAAVPPLKLHFPSPDALADWLRASGLTLREFERLPVYDWYRDEFEPLIDALRERQSAGAPTSAG
jgi:hypothetical protein